MTFPCDMVDMDMVDIDMDHLPDLSGTFGLHSIIESDPNPL